MLGSSGRFTGGRLLGGSLLGLNAVTPSEPPPDPFECPVTLDPIVTSADYVYVKDITNGCVLYAKDETTGHDPASVVKLATATLAMRRKGAALTDTVTVTAADLTAGGSAMGLQSNDVVSYDGLLKGMLLPSGNDAALCLARNIGNLYYADAGNTGNQGVTRFVEAMNDLATELGMTGTTFVNPHGADLGSPWNELTAIDVCAMAEEAYGHSLIRAYADSSAEDVEITGANARTINLTRGTDMIGFGGVIASKGGISGHAGYNYANLFESVNGVEVVVVTMNAATGAQSLDDQKSLISQLPNDYVYLGNDPAPSDASFASVVLLAGFDGSIADESSVARTLTAAGDAQVTATNRLVGSHSLILDGTGDYVEAADADDLSFGSGDFTVECFFSASAEPGDVQTLVGKWHADGAAREWRIYYAPASNQFGGIVSLNGTTTSGQFREALATITPSAVFDGARHHVAMVRNGTELAIYVDGVKGATTANISTSAGFAGSGKLGIGAVVSTAIYQPFAGRMDEVRITKGVARYTADFTPPFAKFPRV